MVTNTEKKINFRQYLTLSVMAYRGEGVPYNVQDLHRDVQIAAQWLHDAADNPRRSGVAQEVLDGNLFIGVVDGQVFFRSGH